MRDHQQLMLVSDGLVLLGMMGLERDKLDVSAEGSHPKLCLLSQGGRDLIPWPASGTRQLCPSSPVQTRGSAGLPNALLPAAIEQLPLGPLRAFLIQSLQNVGTNTHPTHSILQLLPQPLLPALGTRVLCTE